MTGKIVIKQILSNLMSVIGWHSFTEHFRCYNKAFILMYHRILPHAKKQFSFVPPGMFVTTATFEKQVNYLKDRFEIVFVEELVERSLRGEDIGGLCAITFDDGWQDNYTDAFPILSKYRVPATIFLATGFVGTDRIFWPEEICYYLERDIANKYSDDSVPPPYIRFKEKICGLSQCVREIFLERSIEILKGYSPVDREEILAYFRSMFKMDHCPRQMLNWDEVHEMQASGFIAFGAHTVNHEMLDQVSLHKAKQEIVKSREELERHTGNKVNTFAYPNGNHSDRIRQLIDESGFAAAVTTRKGFFSRDMPLLEIPRIAIHEDVSSTIPMFRSRILFDNF